MFKVCALLSFVVFLFVIIHILHCHWGNHVIAPVDNHVIAPVPQKQPEYHMNQIWNDDITTQNKSQWNCAFH